MEKSILAEVAELERMGLDELRSRWALLFEMQPPLTTTRKYLIGRLAYRLQEMRHGGIPEKTMETMQQILPAKDLGSEPSGRDAAMPAPGTIITRTWHGREYTVKVLKKGFEYNGARYRSLSAVAKEITGTHWNGRVFFGVGKPRKRRVS